MDSGGRATFFIMLVDILVTRENRREGKVRLEKVEEASRLGVAWEIATKSKKSKPTAESCIFGAIYYYSYRLVML